MLTVNTSRLSDNVSSVCVSVSGASEYEKKIWASGVDLNRVNVRGDYKLNEEGFSHDLNMKNRSENERFRNLVVFSESENVEGEKNTGNRANNNPPTSLDRMNIQHNRMNIRNRDKSIGRDSKEQNNKERKIKRDSHYHQRVSQNSSNYGRSYAKNEDGEKEEREVEERGARVKRRRYCICVPPLFSHIPSTTLVEFIEFSRILGAHHIVFYLRDMSPEVVRTLDWYTSTSDFITVIPWLLPLSDKTVWYNAQLMAVNDCLYRTMYRFSHVAFNDIDEFIVPHRHSNWAEMIDSFDNMESSSVSADNSNQVQAWRTASGKDTAAYDDVALPSVHCGYSFQSAFFDPLVSDILGHVMYDLESDLRTKVFSRIRTKVRIS